MTNKKLHVLHIPSWYLPFGGQFCLDQSIALQKQGIDVHILANVTLSIRKQFTGLFKYPIIPSFTEEHSIPILKNFKRIYPSIFFRKNNDIWIKKTVQLFDLYKNKYGLPDIIHVHSCCYAASAALFIKEKYGIPYIVTEHWSAFSGKSEHAKKLLNKNEDYIRNGYSQASFILGVSQEIIPTIKQFLSSEIPISALSNIVDVDFFTPPNKRKKNGTFTFFTANDFVYHKGFDTLLEAVSILSKQNYNFKVKIAGDGFQKKEFKNLMNRFDVENRIELLGFLQREGIKNNLHTADAFVIPSRNESQSIAVLEALATGLPIVCTELIPKEFVDEKTGYRVQIENPLQLSEAMKLMIITRNNFKEEEIVNRVKSLSSSTYVANKLIETYQEVLSY